jgi:hypothetical protein
MADTMDDKTNQFEQRVLEGITEVRIVLADMRAKMNMLLGDDGTDGRFSQIVFDVESLKESRSRQRGFIAASGLIATMIGGLIEWLLNRH